MSFRARQAVRCLSAGLIALGLSAAVGVPTAARAAAVIVPHKAVYDLTLARSRTGASVVQAGGTLEFEWGDACKGWTVSQRTRVRMSSPEGQVVNFGWSLESHEAKDGSRYSFFIKRIAAGGERETVRGEANMRDPDKPGIARFTAPENSEVELPAGTLFPAIHTVELIEAAQRGEALFLRTVFDGSGDEGLFQISATITHGPSKDSAPGFDSPLLRGEESWRIGLAFFGLDPTETVPEHEQSLRLYANGVVDELMLDYGEFALAGSLRSLEALPSDC